MNRKRRIILISAGHIASTPRLVKEADTLHGQGYEVRALAVQTVPKVSAIDRELERSKPWGVVNINLERRKKLSRIWERLRRSVAEKKILRGNAALEAFCQALAPWHSAMLEEIRRFTPDLVIAHSIAGLSVAALAAEQFRFAYAFDMEDYHPGECVGDREAPSNRIASEVLARCLRNARYVTAASPCIADETGRVFGVKNLVTILNSFPLENLPAGLPERRLKGLSLYWFSQTIGFDRGLQDAIAACGRVRGEFQLHLRGSISAEGRRVLQSLLARSGVEPRCHIHHWCNPGEMLERAAEHDVGLAMETGESLNRDLAITNKILFYPLAGLAVAATRTRGQAWVMERMPKAGFLYEPGNVGQLANGLQRWVDDPAALRAAQRAARTAAETRFCWEKEAPRFLETVEKAFAS